MNLTDAFVSAVNFSEGARLDVIDAIAGGAQQHCALLDVHSDPDHNRSVITLAGDRDSLVEGILAAADQAIRLIDLGSHRGVHPRLGAIDVVPFTSAAGSILEARVVANAFAARVWEGLHIPVFIYGETPELSLPLVRARAFKDLRPNFGEALHPTAGAICAGARDPLVAYNVNLDTDDLAAARQIASSVRRIYRETNALRSMGFPLISRGLVQVSCNLLRPATLTVSKTFRTLQTLAAEIGTTILESEIVGLIPRSAVEGLEGNELLLTRAPCVLEDALALAPDRRS